MKKIYVVTFGEWDYEGCNEGRKYFASRKSALRFAMSLRRDRSDIFYEVQFSNCFRYEGKLRTSWSTGGDYSGRFISVVDEDVLP